MKAKRHSIIFLAVLALNAQSGAVGKSASAKDNTSSTVAVPPLTWQVDSILLTWKTDDSKNQSSTNGGSAEVIKSQNNPIKEWNFNGHHIVISDSRFKGSDDPFRLFGLRNSEGRLIASGGAWSKGQVAWDRENIEKARKCYQEFKESAAAEKLTDLHLSFSVSFYNNGSEEYFFDPIPVPVFIGEEHIGDAECIHTGVQRIPAGLPKGVPIIFKTDLDAATVGKLVENMKNASPLIQLERSQLKICRASDAKSDVLSTLKKIQNETIPVTFTWEEESMTWRIYRMRGSKPVTLGHSISQLNDKISGLEKNSGKFFDVIGGKFHTIGGQEIGKDGFAYLMVDGKLMKDDYLNAPITKPVEIGLVTTKRLAAEYEKNQRRLLNDPGLNITEYLGGKFELWKAMADKNITIAQVILADCYFDGEGVGKDEREAMKWYRKAADQGLAVAQVALGSGYLAGKGVERDEKEAVAWFRKAADQGNVVAQILLAGCYSEGHGIDKDEKEAAKWIRKASD